MNTTKIILSTIFIMLLLLIGACSTPPPSESVVVNDIRNYVEKRGYGEIIDIHQQGDGKLLDENAQKIAGYLVPFRAAVKLPAGFYAAYDNSKKEPFQGISKNKSDLGPNVSGSQMDMPGWSYPELPAGTIYVMEARIRYWNIKNGGWKMLSGDGDILSPRKGVCPTAKSASECYQIQNWN